MRTLTWYVSGAPTVATSVLPEYTLEGDYSPLQVHIRQKTAGVGRGLVIDILDDGVSIFDTQATLGAGLTSHTWTSFAKALVEMKKGSVITLNVVQENGGYDLTVELELEAD